MCLILLAWQVHPRYPLVVAANRDEFLDRPTAAAAYWDDAPGVLGGRDLDKGGSWLALDRGGRWAAVTNFREGRRSPSTSTSPSRGALVRDYLTGSACAAGYVAALQADAAGYPGFNLLAGDMQGVHYLSNRDGGCVPVSPGIHGLSNHWLDAPWPKVRKGRERLEQLMREPDSMLTEALFQLLLDREQAQDHELPETGVGLDWERALSAPFIVSAGYGTRASTVLLVDHEGHALFEERSFAGQGVETGRQRYSLRLPGGSGRPPPESKPAPLP
jgi:uncharacterized protein with NRDE domain